MGFVFFMGLLTIWFTIGGTAGAQISFNATQTYGIHYFAKEGDDVVLRCELPESATYADIYKEVYPFSYLTLVDKGVLNVGMNRGKYELTINDDGNGKEYKLTIRNLNDYDTAIYGCIFCVRVRRRGFLCPYDFAFLHVVDDLDTTPVICTLASGTNGVFFVGDDLILDCPQENLQISFNGTDVTSSAMSYPDGDRQIYQIQIVNGSFNGTTISCVNMGSSSGLHDSHEKDFCIDLPTISIFSTLEVNVIPERKEIPNGGNVSLTCKSSPPMPSSLEWDLPDANIMFGNISIVETTEGSRLTIENIDFRDSTQSYFEVTCNVTFGSQNAADVATIYQKMNPTTVMTSHVPISNRSDEGSNTTFMRSTIVDIMTTSSGEEGMTRRVEGGNDTFNKTAVIIVSICATFVLFCLFITVVFCFKSCKASKQVV